MRRVLFGLVAFFCVKASVAQSDLEVKKILIRKELKLDTFSITAISKDTALGNNDNILSTQKAVKQFVLNQLANVGSGTVTSASIVNANGFAGTVATATTTPAITLSTTVTGIVKGNGSALSAAMSGIDYAPGTSDNGTGIVKSTSGTGALTTAVAADFPILNQNTTGSAGSFTGNLSGDITGTQSATMIGTGVVTNAKLANSTISGVSLGSNLSNLSVGTGLAGTIYNGSTAQTFAVDQSFSPTWTGTHTFSGKPLILSGNQMTAAWSTTGTGLITNAATYTDNSSSGTVANTTVHRIGQPTLAASGATTYTNSATLTIDGAPVSSTNVTQTNALALRVLAGISSFAGGIASNTSLVNSNIGVPGGAGTATTGTSAGQIAGSTTVNYRTLFNGTTNSTNGAGNSVANVIVGAVATTEASSGTSPLNANLAVKAQTITNAAGATTDATALYVEGPPSGITPTNPATAVWVPNGIARFDGSVGIGTNNPTTKLQVQGTNPLTLLGVAAGTSTTADSILTITSGLVKKVPFTVAANSIKGNNTGSAAAPVDLTGTQATAMLDVFTSSAKGLVPASSGGTTNYLRADGTFAVPAAVIAALPNYADNAAAILGGLVTPNLYRTGDVVKQVHAATPYPSLYMNLYFTSGGSANGCAQVFSDIWSNAVGDEDSYSIFGTSNIIAIDKGSGTYLSIEGKKMPVSGDVTQLYTKNFSVTTTNGYRFDFAPSNWSNWVNPDNYIAILYDSYAGTYMRIPLGGGTVSYTFTGTAGVTNTNRFSIAFTVKNSFSALGNVGTVSVFSSNAAAIAAGFVAGDIYKLSDGTLKVVY